MSDSIKVKCDVCGRITKFKPFQGKWLPVCDKGHPNRQMQPVTPSNE